jgi:hypothetical protein
MRKTNKITRVYFLIGFLKMEPHGQSRCLRAEVPVFAEKPHAGNRFGTQAWSSA